VLDDLNVIRQHQTDSFNLYKPEQCVIGNWSSLLNKTNVKFKGTALLHGINPANGVVIYYNVVDTAAIEMEIKDMSGKLVRKFSSIKDKLFKSYPGAPSADPVLSKKKGLNRFVWDMRRKGIPGVPTAYLEGYMRGHKVPPGDYTIHIKSGENEVSTQCTILSNPNYPLTTKDYKEYDEYMLAMEKTVTEMHQKVNLVFDMKKQLETVLKDVDKKTNAELHKNGKALVTKMLT